MTQLTMETGSHGASGTPPSLGERRKYLGDAGAAWFLLPAIWLVVAFAGLAYVSYSPVQSAKADAPKVTASPFAGTELGARPSSTVAKTPGTGGSGQVAQAAR
jgi:hypothetical protein